MTDEISRNLTAPLWRHQMETFSALLAISAGTPVNSPHKGQWRRALMFSLICVWIIGWVNNREAGDLRRYRAHYDVTLMASNVKRVKKVVESGIETSPGVCFTLKVWAQLKTYMHKMQASRAWISNYSQNILCDVITFPCPRWPFASFARIFFREESILEGNSTDQFLTFQGHVAGFYTWKKRVQWTPYWHALNTTLGTLNTSINKGILCW